MKPEIGLDTLHLNPVEFDLEPHFSAKIKPASFESGTGETAGNFPLYAVSGRVFEGAGAYLSLEHCQLDFTPYSDAKAGTAHVSTKITLTVPKVVSGDNYQTSNCEETRQALKKIESELREAGFKFDVLASLVKRLDLAKTLQNRDEWLVYRPLLDVFKPSRMPGIGFETGKRWGNSRRQIVLYDKLEEMASKVAKKRRVEVVANYPRNSMRAELRLTERSSFQDATSMRTAADVLSDFGHVQNVYRSEFEKKLFRFKPSEVEKMVSEALEVETLASEMTPFIVGGGRWLEAWIKADWASNRVIDAQRLNVIKAAVREASHKNGLAKQNIAKQQAILDSLFLQHANASSTKRTVSDLYAELKAGIISE